MTHSQIVAIKAVTNQLINMMYNDIIEENGIEGFEGWCADGEVFDTLPEEYFDDAMRLMKQVAPLVDDLIYKHLNINEEKWLAGK